MKAIIKPAAGPGLELTDQPLPEHGINDVLIRVRKTSICGTDVHIATWNDWAARTIKPPLIIGHEFVGEIAAVGSNVSDFKVGDLVAGEGHIVCGHCRNCMAGRRHLCARTRGVGIDRSGAFAEYLVIPQTNAWHCDPSIPQEILSAFDPLGNATHTALSFPVLGEDVLVTGCGPIGCMAVAIARHAGARYIVATEPNPYRRDLAKRMGADVVVDPGETRLVEVQRQLGMAEGFDVGLEMSGHPAALRDMIDQVCHGGKIALLGIPSEQQPIDWRKVIFNMITIKGIYGREMYETWYLMTAMIQSGLDIRPLITHRFPYPEFQQAFALMETGNCGKIILDWETT